MKYKDSLIHIRSFSRDVDHLLSATGKIIVERTDCNLIQMFISGDLYCLTLNLYTRILLVVKERHNMLMRNRNVYLMSPYGCDLLYLGQDSWTPSIEISICMR